MKFTLFLIIISILGCSIPNSNNQNKETDYFPLNLGNKWIYEYQQSITGSNWDVWEGIVSWEIVDATKSDTNNVFEISVKDSGIYIDKRDPPGDTTIYLNTNTFHIFESQDNILTSEGVYIQGITSSFALNYHPFDQYGGLTNMKRFQSGLPDTLEVGNSLKILKNVGIIHYEYDYGDITLDIGSMNLISFIKSN